MVTQLPPPTPERIRAKMLQEKELQKLYDSDYHLLLAKRERAFSPPRTPPRSKYLPISMPPPTPDRIRAKEEEGLQKLNDYDCLADLATLANRLEAASRIATVPGAAAAAAADDDDDNGNNNGQDAGQDHQEGLVASIFNLQGF